MGKIYESSLELVGGTPLLRLSRYAGRAGIVDVEILAKLEYLNPAVAYVIVNHLPGSSSTADLSAAEYSNDLERALYMGHQIKDLPNCILLLTATV